MTLTLYRPVGTKELHIIEQFGWKKSPTRLPEQPIFYPVMHEAYAVQITRDWNVLDSRAGFVTRFEVDAAFAQRYPIHTVGASVHTELWVPAEDLETFNQHIVGVIEVIAEYRGDPT
jgi:hypothetical protein